MHGTLLQFAAEAQDLEDYNTVQLTRETGSPTLSLEDLETFNLHTSAVPSIRELRIQDLPRQELGSQSMHLIESRGIDKS